MSSNLSTETNQQSDYQAPRRLLVVDDDPLQLGVLSDRLAAAGYAVTTAHSGEEACELLRRQAFPVIITDYKMPDMESIQLIDRLRRQQADRSYLIAMSAFGTPEERDRSFLHGVDDHISKLLPATELLARIEAGFETIAKRDSLRFTRTMRSCGAMLGRNRDTDEWNISASRLHTELLHAARDKKPLAVFMLHVERQLMPREKSLLTFAQFVYLASAINSILRFNSDFTLPLDASDGLVRLLVVLPETNLQDARAIRSQLCTMLVESASNEPNEIVIDESAMRPDCAIGVAAVETWDTTTVTNVAELIATAEQSMERLTLPM